jgi:predicted RNA-binding Zn-ribbon protein involved in translation (DUF1610 family)
MRTTTVTCWSCEKPIRKGDRVWVHKDYGDTVVFHERCREQHKDYRFEEWGSQGGLFKDPV